MDATGERYVPEQGWAWIAYEHLARYLMAQPWATDKVVLDLASGEGYGSNLLAARAALVIGLDRSAEAIAHASHRYRAASGNLHFIRGDATRLPLANASVDLVVAFELLEHLEGQSDLLAEVRRVLRPRGLFVVSTPNRVAYSELTGYRNPFHVRELSFEELRALVERHFPHVSYFSQKNVIGSAVAPVDENGAARLQVRRVRRAGQREFEPVAADTVDHLYFVAVCSDARESLEGVAGVLLADRDQRLLHELIAEQAAAGITGAAHERVVVEEALRCATKLAAALNARVRRAADEPAAPPERECYDLIIPVFNAPEMLKRCLDSLLAHTDPKHTVHVVDDASPDPRIAAMMAGYAARHPQVRYYRLVTNLGFPGAVNAALSSTTRDVVIINSDTEFPPGWLARMERCRRSHPAIHVVSPLSNNATICSVPGFNENNALPPGMSVGGMDRLVQQTSVRHFPAVPTAVGFCMLMTRAAIEAVGPLDMAFGRGYGEEVDWCQRAWRKGFASVICDDVYVYHHGEAAFAQVAEKHALREGNQRRVAARWPLYEASVRAYCLANPLRYQQQRLFERLRSDPDVTRPSVLHVTHAFGEAAGTELFTRQLIDGTRGAVSSTVLYPAALSAWQDAAVDIEGGGHIAGGLLKIRVNGRLVPSDHAFRGASLSIRAPAIERLFADVVAGVQPDVVQFNHVANFGTLALPLIAQSLGARVALVLHDYYLLCPDWNLLHVSGRACGEPRARGDNARCLDCAGARVRSRDGVPSPNLAALLEDRAALARAVLERADLLIAPSAFVRDQFARGYGDAIGHRIRVVAHGTVAYRFEPTYVPDEALRVAFVGNVNPMKGIDVFLEASRRLADRPIRFRVLGRAPPGQSPRAGANVEVRGPYPQRELPRLLQEVDVVYIGSLANETYCLTLDEALRAGAAVVASAVGAIPERVRDGDNGLLIPPGDPVALVEAIDRLDRDRALLARLRAGARATPLRSVAECVGDYLGLYRALTAPRDDLDALCASMRAQPPAAVEAPVGLAQHLAAHGITLDLPLAAEGALRGASRPPKARRR